MISLISLTWMSHLAVGKRQMLAPALRSGCAHFPLLQQRSAPGPPSAAGSAHHHQDPSLSIIY